jgi:hypothetical protein
MSSTNAYLSACDSVAVAVRAEALRSSRLYPVNYKIAPSRRKEWQRYTQVRSKIMVGKRGGELYSLFERDYAGVEPIPTER